MTRRRAVFADRELVALLGDQPELLAICDAILATQAPRSRRPRRPVLLVAVVAALLAVTAPAIALTGGILDFASAPRTAPPLAVAFEELSIGAPAGMDPRADASEARTIDAELFGGSLSLSLAPTAEGGFCALVSDERHVVQAGCDARGELSTSFGYTADRWPGPAVVSGWVRDAKARTAEVLLVDGSLLTLPLVRVSAPIETSFFVHQASTLPRSITIRDGAGREIVHERIPAPPAP